MFTLAKRLAAAGILGLNRRNADYTSRYNARHLYPRVDNKLETKRLALQAHLAVPELYGVIKIEQQINYLPDILRPYDDFVIKPAHGSGGDGVLVVAGRTKDLYRLASGLLMNQAELGYYVSNILSGLFSLGGHPDHALIEYRVQFDPVFKEISFQGVPDIRIIVFLGVPVMAMVRLPTRVSQGRANLHQGAIGAGIDMASGRTLPAVWHHEIVNEHPDTGKPVTDVAIPHWDKLLEIAAQSYELTGLGYVGVDLVLDRDKGPLILELNARPGLSIQLANRAGLQPRLQLVERHLAELGKLEDRVAFAKEKFSAADKVETIVNIEREMTEESLI